MLPFGPQLIGQTEKTLNALLHTALAPHDLGEPQWVTLRLATQHDPAEGDLATFVARTAHLDGGAGLVEVLSRRGLLAGDRLTAAGQEVVDDVSARIAELTGPIWADLDPEDVAATQRTLTLVLERARGIVVGPAQEHASGTAEDRR